MTGKLFVSCVIVCLIAFCNSQWTPLSPRDVEALQNEFYFKAGLAICKDKIAETGHTFKSIYVIRVGPGVEYTLNDTDNNVHLCTCLRVAAPKFMNMTYYAFFPMGQRKEEILDQSVVQTSSSSETNRNLASEESSSIEIILNGLEYQDLNDESQNIEIFDMNDMQGIVQMDDIEAKLLQIQQARNRIENEDSDSVEQNSVPSDKLKSQPQLN